VTLLRNTGHICADCGEDIMYTDECVLVQVVQLQEFAGKTFHHPVIDEDDIHGDFLFEPYFFCFSCWDDTYKDVQESIEDGPPIEDDESQHDCTLCGSGIRDWEYAGSFSIGECRVSVRSPNGVSGPRFYSDAKPETLCLYCLRIINENYIELWANLTQAEECMDCTQLRCWRFPQCGCGCHTESPDDHDDEDDEDDSDE
jgi:hypothetical protein